MPKFLVGRDIAFLRNVAREIVETVTQQSCVLYKINLNETKVNLYGESLNKTWHRGVELFCLINKEPEAATYEGFGANTTQNVEFRFDREHIKERNIYPEIGDVIYFDNSYYEIDNTNEIQFAGGLPGDYEGERADAYNPYDHNVRNWSVICSTFMVSKSSLNIEERIK